MISTRPQTVSPETSARGGNGSLHGRSSWATLSVSIAASDGLAEAEASAEHVDDLRRWHLLGTEAKGLTVPADDVLPALLAPFRQVEKVRHDFPLLVWDSEAEGRVQCEPLSDILVRWVDAVGGDIAIVRDNLALLEQEVARLSTDDGADVQARPLLEEAGRAMRQRLALKKEHDSSLAGQLASLITQVPEDAWLLGLSPVTPTQLLYRAARDGARQRREQQVTEIERLRKGLRALLEIERGKGQDAREADALRGELGSVERFVDAAALSRLMGPHRGSKTMDATRRARVETALAALDGFVGGPPPPALTIVRSKEASAHLLGRTDVEEIADPAPLSRAIEVYDARAKAMVEVFRAIRVGRLELEDAYRPERHDAWFEAFRVASFSDAEILSLPTVAVVISGTQLTGDALDALSRALRSGRCVKVLVETTPSSVSETDADVSLGAQYRFELGYFGISHREALVHQSTAARPQHFLEGVVRALGSTRPSLHAVAAARDLSGETPPLGPWLFASAAIEGRALPLFLYDPEAGRSWARRFVFGANPQPEADWPAYQLELTEGIGKARSLTLAFTFADFAMLEPAYRQNFRFIPAGYPEGELLSVDAYLAASPEEATRRIPYLWTIDSERRLRRVAITQTLALACRDRLSFWGTLQELSGARSEHVDTAVAAVREEMERLAAQDRESLMAEHAAELERVRREVAGEAMQKLAASLLETDLDALVTSSTSSSTVASAAPSAAAEAAPAPAESEEVTPAPEVAEEDEGFDDPWIESALCTSCNDCININSKLFVYNANKQATIGDPKAGTFAQLVKAAETCPSRCIHPGKPLDPDEPNLDELVKRAAKFN